MNEQPSEPSNTVWPLWKSLSIFCLVFSLIWVPLAYGLFNKQKVEDAIPLMTAGVVELIATLALVVTLLCFCFFLILRWQSNYRWVGLLAFTAILVGSGYSITKYYRIVFDGDMKPLRIEAINDGFSLDIQAQPVGHQLMVSKSSFPQFLGPNRNLKVDWLTIDKTAKAKSIKVNWCKPLGFGWSGFTVVDGVAFTMEQHGPWEVVTAYQALDGKRIWYHRDRHRHDEAAGGVGPRSTPTFHNNRLYTLGAIGTLNCLAADTGKLIWQKELTKEFDLPTTVYNQGQDNQYDVENIGVIWGRAASPLVAGDKIVVPIGGQTGNRTTLAAFSLQDGSKIWATGERQISYGSPDLVTLLGKQQILIINEDTVTGHDPETGVELWQHSRPGESGGSANTSQPVVVAPNQVLLTKEYGLGGELIEVSIDQDDKWSTQSVWKNSRVLKTKFTIAAISGNYAYCISGGNLECVDWRTGERMWRGDRFQHGQMLLVNDVLVVMSEVGDLNFVQATPDEYILLTTKQDVLSGRCWNTLCLFEDKLLVRSELEAVCLTLPTVDPTTQAAEMVSTRGNPANAAVLPVSNRGNFAIAGLDSSNLLPQDETTQKPSRQTLLNDIERTSAKGDKEATLKTLDSLLENYPDEAFAYYQRGCNRCWAGDFVGSVTDFDKYVALRPEVERRLWERGISQYYAGKFKEGAKQFQLYQTYHDNDVENSVWRYLCQAKFDGLEKAQADMLPIKNDPRKPLMEIYKLYRGETDVPSVEQAIVAGSPSGSELESRKFYGNYYLALYFEARNDDKSAARYIAQSVSVPSDSRQVSRYMWDVARVHQTLILNRLKAKEKETTGSSKDKANLN